MSQCKHCNSEFRDDFYYCQICGSHVQKIRSRNKSVIIAVSTLVVLILTVIYVLFIRIDFNSVKMALTKNYDISEWVTVAGDGSYLKLDTNPDDGFDYYEFTPYELIYNIHDILRVPDSVVERMNSTRAIDGIQTAETLKLRISWSYHPDNGLEIIYEKKWGF